MFRVSALGCKCWSCFKSPFCPSPLRSATPPTGSHPSASGSAHRGSCCGPSWRCPAPAGTSPSCSCASSSACHCTTSSHSTLPRAAGWTVRSAAWCPWTTCATGRWCRTSPPWCRSCRASRPCSLPWTGPWTGRRGLLCHGSGGRPQSPPGGLGGWDGPGSEWNHALASGRYMNPRPGVRLGETGAPDL